MEVEKGMKILQIGYPKSGNYWLYKIIQEALHIAGIDQKNYIRNHPIYRIAQNWELSYPEQVDINMLDIQYSGCFFRISSIFRKRIEDMEAYIESNTHVWSHSNYCRSSDRVFPLFDKIVYIIRDPRDVALSKADFAFTPYMRKHYPTWHRTPAEYLETEAERIAVEWKQHVEEYVKQSAHHNIQIVFYERLQRDFERELKTLVDYFGFNFTESQRSRIAAKVSFSHMRKQSPQHVRKGRHYKWMDMMSEELMMKLTAISQELLSQLEYPTTPAKAQLPNRPAGTCIP